MKISKVTVRKRLFVVLMIGSLIYITLISRLGYIQLVLGNELSSKARDSWTRTIPYEGKRGRILDRNGIVLAYNISSPSILAIPVQIKDKAKTAQQLAKVLNANEKDILKMISKKERIVRIQPAGRKISEDKAQAIRDLKLKGIVIAEDNKRHYPYGAFLSHVLGFAGIDNQGLTGLELYYNDLLRGRPGFVSYYSDASGREMPGTSETYTNPVDGLDLVLTIDKNIQSYIERELDLAMLKYEPKNIIAIAMDPKTGEVLGMASRPNYNPENFREVPSEIYNRNLPIWMTYEPGSTFKIITLAAALQEGKVDLKADFFDPGYAKVAGATLRCWKKGGHGSETYLEVVQNSCNPGFVAMGLRLGKDTLFKYIKDFGFGQKTGIDINGEENGIMFKPSQIGPVELATTAFGQGVSVTPIQQVDAVSAAINGGYLMKPHLAKEWQDPLTGEVVKQIQPEVERQVISEETSKQVALALESVVAQGTGRNAYIEGYRVGGKTGTAQKAVNGRYLEGEHIVSFVGFAPANDPKIVIYVAVDNPKGIQFGGVVAAPIVKAIMEDSLHSMGIKPSTEGVKRKYIYGEVQNVEVPNLIGETISDIQNSLYSSFSIATAGSGKYVAGQAPKPGAKIERGSTIRVFLTDKKPPNDLQ